MQILQHCLKNTAFLHKIYSKSNTGEGFATLYLINRTMILPLLKYQLLNLTKILIYQLMADALFPNKIPVV